MRTLLALALCGLSIAAWPKDGPTEVTLLLGIHGVEKGQKQKAYRMMELDFHSQWGWGSYAKSIRDASYIDLFKTLRNPFQKVVFWVGHAGVYDNAPGITNGLITDAYGDDIKNLFKVLPENLYWLGLIGCKGETILRRFAQEGYYNHLAPRFVSSQYARTFPFGFNILHRRLRDYSGVILDSTTTNTLAVQGLRWSMASAKWPTLNVAEPPAQTCQMGPALHMEAYRRSEDSSKTLAPISVEASEFPLTIFDRDSTQTFYPLLLPLKELEGFEDVTLVVQGREGFDPLAEEEELGEITFWSPTLGLSWERVEIAGRPLGKTQHVYRLDAASRAKFASLRGQGIYWSRPCYQHP